MKSASEYAFSPSVVAVRSRYNSPSLALSRYFSIYSSWIGDLY